MRCGYSQTTSRSHTEGCVETRWSGAGDVAAAAAGGGAYLALRASKGRWWTRLPKLNMQDGFMVFEFTKGG
jgi:hypothetical protein